MINQQTEAWSGSEVHKECGSDSISVFCSRSELSLCSRIWRYANYDNGNSKFMFFVMKLVGDDPARFEDAENSDQDSEGMGNGHLEP